MTPAESGAAKAVRGEVTRRRTDRPTYQPVYLWQWPIRAMHWFAAASIVLLIVTGFYIGQPYFLGGPESQSPYVMGWMRFLHFTGAGVLVAVAIVRTYWLFAGNKYERWPALFPVRPRDWKNLVRMAKYYVLVRGGHPPRYVGHNPLQQLSYTAVYALAAFMVASGFALYGLHNPGGFFYDAFGWFGQLLGGAQATRFWHHVLAWAFLIFIPAHIYLSIRSDVMEREGTMSAIFSGKRFVRADVEYEDD